MISEHSRVQTIQSTEFSRTGNRGYTYKFTFFGEVFNFFVQPAGSFLRFLWLIYRITERAMSIRQKVNKNLQKLKHVDT